MRAAPRGGAEDPDWEANAASAAFRELRRAKARFVVPAMVFFVVYYFALPLLVGYAPRFMETEVFGPVNLAYLFALSQFFMAWALAFAYVRTARRWDTAARRIRQDAGRAQKP
jgi:uncharacterized membrane protein (DUF485 family)